MSRTAVSRPAAPAGYVSERERGALVVALPSVIEQVRSCIAASGTLYAAAASRAGAQTFTGRGTAYRIAMPGGDWVVRHYRRGGAAARVLQDTYLHVGTPRPLRELNASIAARSRGVDSPEVLAAVVYAATPFYRADLATRYVPDSRDLAETVLGDTRAGDEVRAAAWHAAGALLRAAFRAGVVHADLNMRNILIAGAAAAPRALLLDLDRARVRSGGAVTAPARGAMLRRLHRSRRKLEAQYGRSASTHELSAFEQGLNGSAAA